MSETEVARGSAWTRRSRILRVAVAVTGSALVLSGSYPCSLGVMAAKHAPGKTSKNAKVQIFCMHDSAKSITSESRQRLTSVPKFLTLQAPRILRAAMVHLPQKKREREKITHSIDQPSQFRC